MSPQVLKNSYNEKCDVWSVGILAYYMLFRKNPFIANSRKAKAAEILKGDISYDSTTNEYQPSEEAKNFLRKMLAYEEDDRYSA